MANPPGTDGAAAPVAPGTPVVTALRVVPVAGHDSMLLNLSGVHGPYFTRNVVLLTDAHGRVGVGEAPGGEAIRRTLQDAAPLVTGPPVMFSAVLQEGRWPPGPGPA